MAQMLLGLLLLQIFTPAHCRCLNGWQEKFGNCYAFVNVRRSHHLGTSICERYGSKLANPENVSELKYLNETAANEFKNTNKFWIGYSKGQNTDLDRYWDNTNPKSSEGNCVAMNNLGLFMKDNCFWPHSVVCQRKACGQNEYPCINGNCIPSTKVCNGQNDCRDQSDEIQCATIGNYFYNSLSDKISANKSVLSRDKCWFTIEVPIGYRIIMEFQLYNVKKNDWFLVVNKEKNKFTVIGRPNFSSTKTFYSKNNFVIMEYIDYNNAKGNLFDSNYTSIAIPSPILQAISDPQELSFPESWMMFLDVELSWKIKAAKGIIILQLFELVFPSSGRNSFYIWYGDNMVVNLTDSTGNQTFTANTSEVFIYFYSENEARNVNLNLTYQMQLCQPGEFRNNTSIMCQDCNEGYYQPNVERGKCLKCPENHTTLSNKSKSKEDCIFYCVSAGYEVGPSGNECIPCAKGFYKKATAGVEEKCSRCPQNFTTSLNQGATTLKDCDLLECLAGYVHNRSSDTCMPCPKGTYKSERGYHQCIACRANMTTFKNASTRKTDCLIPNCPAGEEPTGDYLSCKKCSLGYYKSDASSIHCIQCPIGTTTLQTGATSASQCSKKIVPNTTSLNTVDIVIEIQYSFVNCEMNKALHEVEIKSAMEKRIEKMSKEWDLCIGDCLVTVNVNCPTSNRKKRATGNGIAQVQVGNVKSNADSKTKNERTLTENLFNQDCKVDEDEYEVELAKLVSCEANASCSYSKLVSNKCEFCPAGTKAIETGCEDCPEGTYSGINQRNCTNCSFPLTSKSRSNSSSQCLSKCILDSTYCKNGGICSKAVHDMHHICSCSKKFSGDQCEIYNEPYDHGKGWLFVLIGCIGFILVIIQLVAVIVKCLREKHKEKKRMIRRAGNENSAFFYWSPIQGHRANQPFSPNWQNIRKISY